MAHFEKNLETLKRRNPRLAARVRSCAFQGTGIEIVAARSGEPVPVVGGRALHSTYQPGGESKKLVTSQPLSQARAVVVLGLGFGYLVEELLRQSGASIVVVERRLEMLRAAMESRDLEKVLSSVDLICAEPPASIMTRETVADAIGAQSCSVVAHDPSVRLEPAYYDAVRTQLRRGISDSKQRRLRVMVVSPVSGGSWPISRYAASGLRAIGCDVEFLDLSPFQSGAHYLDESLRNTTVQARMSERFHGFLCEFTYWKIKQLQPELVLFLAQAPVSVELLKKLQEEKVRTAFWFVENYKLFSYWKEVAPLCNHFFTIQRSEFFARLEASSSYNHFYLPLACDPAVHQPMALSAEELSRYGSAVSVAGFGYYNRLHMMQCMTDFDLKLWGPGWNRASALEPFIQADGLEFDTETMLKIYNASEVSVNLHSSTYSTGVEPGGDFVNPRTFELAACGAFQLTDERAELGELFEVGQEVITFKDTVTLREQVRYYLDHPNERKVVCQRARQRALAEHTYAIRMRQMLECIYPSSWIDRRTAELQEPDLASRLLAEAPRGHPLHPVLKDAQADSQVTLQGLIAEMAQRSANPGREEITLRWMDNLLAQGRRR